ncbi:MAG: SurA N-terminal domain-containing protein [Sphingomonas sp.]
MLSILRRLTQSKIGLFITLAALVVIALAFAAGDITNFGGGAGRATGGDTIATVGKTKITAEDLKAEVLNEVNAYRQQNPQLTTAQFIQGGGFDATVDRLINSLALQQFAQAQGMAVSKKAVDGQIASIPGLQGPNGQFDPALYQQLLQQQRLTDAGVRAQIRQGIYGQMLTGPIVGASQVPAKLALPYASLLLEKRSGAIGFIPAKEMPAGPAPTDQELTAWYQHHIDRYTVPERRVIRYAIVSPDAVKARATPTDAEIAQQYKAQAARFAPTEKRTVKQVVVADQAAANALAAKVKAGTAIDAAAKAAGLEASTATDVSKADFAKQSSAELANAVFAARQGDVVGPVKTGFGFSVARIEKVTQDPGKTLAEAHDVLAKEIEQQKTNDLLGQIHDKIDDALNGGATFDEVVADQKLKAAQTAPITQAGFDPTDPASRPDPQLAQIVQSGFDAQQGDSPELVQVGQDGSFAIASLGRIVPAAPQPLARIRDKVAADFTADRADQAAHKLATEIVAKVNKGASLVQAFTEAKLPAGKAIQSISTTRAQIAANPQGAPPPLALMFSTPAKQGKLLEAPNGAGWLVVYTDTIERGDASAKPDVVKATRSDLGQFVGREYAEQFAAAARKAIGVTRNDAAIAEVRQQLLGGTGDQP